MATSTEQNGLVYSSSQEEILDIVCGLIDESQREYLYDRRKHDRHSLAVLIKATPIKDGRRLGTNSRPSPTTSRPEGCHSSITPRLKSNSSCCDFRASISGQ